MLSQHRGLLRRHQLLDSQLLLVGRRGVRGPRLLHCCCNRHLSCAHRRRLLLCNHGLLLRHSCSATCRSRCLHNADGAHSHSLLLHLVRHQGCLLRRHSPASSINSLLRHCCIGQRASCLGGLQDNCLLRCGASCCRGCLCCACRSSCLLRRCINSSGSTCGILGGELASSSSSSLLRCASRLLASISRHQLLRRCLAAAFCAIHLAGGDTCSLLSCDRLAGTGSCFQPSSLLHHPCGLERLSSCSSSLLRSVGSVGSSTDTSSCLLSCSGCLLLLGSRYSCRLLRRCCCFLRCRSLLSGDDVAGGALCLLRLALRCRIRGLPRANGRAGRMLLGGRRRLGKLHSSGLTAKPARQGARRGPGSGGRERGSRQVGKQGSMCLVVRSKRRRWRRYGDGCSGQRIARDSLTRTRCRPP